MKQILTVLSIFLMALGSYADDKIDNSIFIGTVRSMIPEGNVKYSGISGSDFCEAELIRTFEGFAVFVTAQNQPSVFFQVEPDAVAEKATVNAKLIHGIFTVAKEGDAAVTQALVISLVDGKIGSVTVAKTFNLKKFSISERTTCFVK